MPGAAPVTHGRGPQAAGDTTTHRFTTRQRTADSWRATTHVARFVHLHRALALCQEPPPLHTGVARMPQAKPPRTDSQLGRASLADSLRTYSSVYQDETYSTQRARACPHADFSDSSVEIWPTGDQTLRSSYSADTNPHSGRASLAIPLTCSQFSLPRRRLSMFGQRWDSGGRKGRGQLWSEEVEPSLSPTVTIA